MGYLIRPVMHTDIDDIRNVAKITWNSTYEDIYSKDFIEHFIDMAYSKKSLEASISRDKEGIRSRFLVAELEGLVVGYAQIMEPVDSVTELIRIYVNPSIQGKGIGKALLKSLIELDSAIRKVFVWIERENNVGKQFYIANGFDFVEEKEEVVNGTKLVLNKYVKQIET